MKRALTFLCGVCIAAAQAYADPRVDAVDRIIIPVSDLARASGFYTGALSFTRSDTDETQGITLRLGGETIGLVRHDGRPLPHDSRSNDRWFQHLAIVVSDIDRAYAIVLRKGAAPISTGPQELPAWNPNAGGIRAVYFRDPDGHPLELIQFPRGKGDPRWQDRHRLFLGIDHSAVAVRNTDASLAFYRDRLGLHVAGTSENWGVEQERLSAVPGAHIRITSLRAGRGPGVELLDYLMPGDGRPMPADTTANDLWAEEIVMRTVIVPQFAERLRDPDGHAIGLFAEGKEASR
jgi:catechol 2,3-dioxygenase-like lactoylglutathione lyase family enzyme